MSLSLQTGILSNNEKPYRYSLRNITDYCHRVMHTSFSLVSDNIHSYRIVIVKAYNHTISLLGMMSCYCG